MDHSRTDEYRQFLNWMQELIAQEKPDVLLVCGDVFDTSTPGETTRELYCDFLSRADEAGCGQIIITAGNHDGVAQLDVAKPLLKRHHCTVITSLNTDSAASCLIPIIGESGAEVGLVCAVPYLRPSEVSLPQAENEREYSYVRGVAAVYDRVAQLASEWKAAHPGLPVVAMGHLPVIGVEKTSSTRSLIGTLDVMSADIFAPVFDYVALGHIHKMAELEGGRVRYSGSPLSIGVDEARYEHCIFAVECAPGERDVRPVAVPQPIRFETSECADRAELEQLIEHLKQGDDTPLWLSLEYRGSDMSTEELNTLLRKAFSQETAPVIRAARLLQMPSAAGRRSDPSAKLTDYTPEHIFRRALDRYLEESPEQAHKRAELTELFNTVMSEIQNN